MKQKMTDEEIIAMVGDCGTLSDVDTSTHINGFVVFGMCLGFLLLMNVCARYGY